MKLKPQTIRKAVAPKTAYYGDYNKRNCTFYFSSDIKDYLSKSAITRKSKPLF